MREKYKTLLIALICLSSFTFLVSCSPKKNAASLTVVPVWEGKPINCQNMLPEEPQWQIQKLAFFLSNIQLETEGEITSVKSDKNEAVSLVRIAQQTCAATLNLISDSPLMSGAQLSFDLGVPFELNHLNPVMQSAPMNEPDMFWTWRNGYKFFRMDARSKADSWAYHLGSVGCVSESAVRAPGKACAQPNLTRHQMTVPPGDTYSLYLHLDKLLEGITPKQANRCVMHGETEPACQLLFANVSNTYVPLFSLEAR